MRKPKTKLFEFYRVLKDSSDKSFQVEPLKPIKKRILISGLTQLCAESFGAGNFVALEIPHLEEGLPLNYWIMKIRSGGHRAKKQIHLPEEMLKNLRSTWALFHAKKQYQNNRLTSDGIKGKPLQLAKVNMPFTHSFSLINDLLPDSAKLSPYKWQRGVEAAQIAHYLDKLPEPGMEDRKPSGGRQPNRFVDYALSLRHDNIPFSRKLKLVIDKLKRETNIPEYDLDQRARCYIESARRRFYRNKIKKKGHKKTS